MMGIFVVTSTVNILFFVPVFIFLLLSFCLRQFYIKTSVSLRRLEAACIPIIITNYSPFTILKIYILKGLYCIYIYCVFIARSPVFSLVSDTVLGLTTIRAHQRQESHQKMFDERQDVNTSAYYLFLAAGRWLSVCLNFAVMFYLACVIFTCISLRGSKLYPKILFTIFYLLSFDLIFFLENSYKWK